MQNVHALLTPADSSTLNRLFTSSYEALRALARRQLRRQRAQPSLGETSLVHEAYERMSRIQTLSFPDRARFIAYAARVMRALAIDSARRRSAVKRGRANEITLNEHEVPAPQPASKGAALGHALEQLGRTAPSLAELVDLHFFGGLSFAEIATLRAVSERTVQRDWKKARMHLRRDLNCSLDD